MDVSFLGKYSTGKIEGYPTILNSFHSFRIWQGAVRAWEALAYIKHTIANGNEPPSISETVAEWFAYFERQGPHGWWVYCKRACNLHSMHASLGWMRRELCWRRMCNKFARMAVTITSTSKNESCSQSGRGQLPPSMRKMSTLALDMYNSITYETHCRFGSQGQVKLSLPLGKSTCWSSCVEMMHSILTHYKRNLNRFHCCTVCMWLL